MSVKLVAIPSLTVPRNPNALPIPKGAEYPFRLVVKPRYRKRVDSEDLLQALAGWIPEPMHPYQSLYR